MLTDLQIITRLVLTVVLSGLIGLERQLHKRTAGLRTHILVSLGSCLIMLTSLYVFDIYKEITKLDPSRIAAGVITGIGFLGAGTIIRDREGVRGLTTAASLWVVAGIGLATGCGFKRAAIYATVLTLVVLFFLRYIEKYIFLKESGRVLK
ncbi:MAG: MgtC/SapB family protein [Candidatus Omnitrophica bacterium]|nr:MgtC/SapB family protein [Candidatus Omnitrophota bacterium]MDD4981747.1 MgtC/SapB family protein [Candidatus Omnitrophota bacterium]MDD5665052.1 MgtC/SapB family protein [Candidatus Omnitrophota bacterium]